MWINLPLINTITTVITKTNYYVDRLCGIVVRVPGYRFRGSVSIPGATKFSEE
jgi:hypothetical protein